MKEVQLQQVGHRIGHHSYDSACHCPDCQAYERWLAGQILLERAREINRFLGRKKS